MKWGIKDSDYLTLKSLVLQPLQLAGIKVYVFGSRSRGTHHPFSDLDLLLIVDEKNPLNTKLLSKIKEDIEESRFPIKVDFVLNQELAPSYRESVEKDKKLIE